MIEHVIWLVLVVFICGLTSVFATCEDPLVHVSRHVAMSGREQRLSSFTSQFDNVRLSLEYDEDAGIKEDEWAMDIDYKTVSCLNADNDWGEVLDEADEALLSREARPEVGYVRYDGTTSFKLHAHPLDWQFAQETCRREGGRLAVVDTQDKVAAMKTLLQANPGVLQTSVLREQVLVGINDVKEEGVFQTSTGEEFRPWNQSVWFPGEPDDARPGEDCVTFHVRGNIRDVPCYYELPFICERDEP